MSNKLRKCLILFYFILFYFIFLLDEMHLTHLFLKKILLTIVFIDILFLIYILWKLFKQKKLYVSNVVKIIFFTLVISLYFLTEQSLLKLFMYSIGDSGGWIRNNIYENINYQFQWYEVLFWNFVFSIHYPIYIFIFFKPFVNYLDKSIRKKQKG